MQIWAESGKSALPICNYSQILYQFLTFTQNLKRSPRQRYIVVIIHIFFHAFLNTPFCKYFYIIFSFIYSDNLRPLFLGFILKFFIVLLKKQP